MSFPQFCESIRNVLPAAERTRPEKRRVTVGERGAVEPRRGSIVRRDDLGSSGRLGDEFSIHSSSRGVAAVNIQIRQQESLQTAGQEARTAGQEPADPDCSLYVEIKNMKPATITGFCRLQNIWIRSGGSIRTNTELRAALQDAQVLTVPGDMTAVECIPPPSPTRTCDRKSPGSSIQQTNQLSNVLQSSSGSVGSGSQTSFLSDVLKLQTDEQMKLFLCWNFDGRTDDFVFCHHQWTVFTLRFCIRTVPHPVSPE